MMPRTIMKFKEELFKLTSVREVLPMLEVLEVSNKEEDSNNREEASNRENKVSQATHYLLET